MFYIKKVEPKLVLIKSKLNHLCAGENGGGGFFFYGICGIYVI
ncbi:hypothetical protein OAI84_00570 [bacterium]|nr:hypothetical protein [bacterium]